MLDEQCVRFQHFACLISVLTTLWNEQCPHFIGEGRFNLNFFQWRGAGWRVLLEMVVSGVCRVEKIFYWHLLWTIQTVLTYLFFPIQRCWAGVWSGLVGSSIPPPLNLHDPWLLEGFSGLGEQFVLAALSGATRGQYLLTSWPPCGQAWEQ